MAELGGRAEALAVGVVFAGAEHDHAAAEGELGVGDGVVGAGVDGLAGEAEDAAKPVDGGVGVAVALAGDDGGAEIGHGENLRGKSSMRAARIRYILAGMRVPAGDGELVRIMDAALAEAAAKAGHWLACRPGCTPCCHGAFAIDALDVARLRDELERLRERDPAAAEAVETRARLWWAEWQAEFPGDRATGRLGTSDADAERFEEFANEAACPALDPETGTCTVYEGRPMTCRVFGPPVRMEGGLGCCELCFAGATAEETEACEMTVPQEMAARLAAEMGEPGETVVAWALLPGR